LWVDGAGAVIAGDTLADFGNGLGLNEWLRGDSKRDRIVAGLRPLLDLSVERVLPTHGGPADRAALERALS
jgi:glyoxylase-like metal-dependent hydrolase (beta-lactamase superfamily II)